MPTSDLPEPGETVTYARTFTDEEVETFAELSKDRGYHHVVENDEGRLVLHGLLTATMPTKIGGDVDYVARSMEFEFPRPAYTGEEIICELTVEDVARRDGRTELEASFVCETGAGVVLRGRTDGVVMG
ncbi:MAG: dehydratase [Halobacteriales archaeon]